MIEWSRIVDNHHAVLTADISVVVILLMLWLIFGKKDYIALGMILVYVSMFPIWHYFH